MKTIIGAIVFIACMTVQPCPCLGEKAASSIKVRNVSFQSAHVRDVLETIALHHHIVIGLYGSSTDPNVINDTVDITVAKGTVKDILDALVKAKPQYTWRQDSGLVSVYVGTPLSLLNLEIKSLDATDIKRSEVTGEIFQHLPEVKAWLQENSCQLLGHEDLVGMRDPGYVEDQAGFTFHFRNEPLRSILSQIAHREGAYFWYVVREDSSSGSCGILVHLEHHVFSRRKP